MQTMTRAVLAVGLLACVLMSAVQVAAKKPPQAACAVINGACVTGSCNGECGPLFPATCACIHN